MNICTPYWRTRFSGLFLTMSKRTEVSSEASSLKKPMSKDRRFTWLCPERKFQTETGGNWILIKKLHFHLFFGENEEKSNQKYMETFFARKILAKIIFTHRRTRPKSLTKISIFDEKLYFWPKHSTNPNPDLNFDFRSKFLFLAKIWIFHKIFIFRPKFRFSAKIEIFHENYDFWQKFRLCIWILIFDQNRDFWPKFNFLLSIWAKFLLIFVTNDNLRVKPFFWVFCPYKRCPLRRTPTF